MHDTTESEPGAAYEPEEDYASEGEQEDEIQGHNKHEHEEHKLEEEQDDTIEEHNSDEPEDNPDSNVADNEQSEAEQHEAPPTTNNDSDGGSGIEITFETDSTGDTAPKRQYLFDSDSDAPDADEEKEEGEDPPARTKLSRALKQLSWTWNEETEKKLRSGRRTRSGMSHTTIGNPIMEVHMENHRHGDGAYSDYLRKRSLYGGNRIETTGVDSKIMLTTQASEDASLQTEQMSIKRGLRIFGDDGVNAIRKEMMQLHERKVGVPVKKSNLSRQELDRVLAYHMFLKRKRCGKVKGRGCADGRKQRVYTLKQDARSPTVAIESVLLSCVIDAKEGRDVAVCDIPGAFMQADMDELVHIRLAGKMAELLVEIDPGTYSDYVTIENGEAALYLELKKALYGTLRAARLFYERLKTSLTKWGFKCNEYDECVANKMINERQCTIIWHVDDLKISHVDPQVVDQVIDMIDEEYGQEEPISRNRGKVHHYLGM